MQDKKQDKTQNKNPKQALTRFEFETSVIVKAWKDEDFLKRLREDPKSAILKDFGYQVPENVKINLLEEDDATMYIVVPHIKIEGNVGEIPDEELMKIAGGHSDAYSMGLYSDQRTLDELTFSKDPIY